MGTSSHIFIARLNKLIESQQSSSESFYKEHQNSSSDIQKAAVAEFIKSYDFFCRVQK